MTTKKIQVRTNLQGLEDATFTCDNREDAIAYITNTLMGNSQINPQDLILEEVEVKSELAQVCDEVLAIMNKNDIEPTKIEASQHTNEDGELYTIATIERKDTHLPLCGHNIIKLANLMQAHPNLGWWVSLPEGNVCISNNPARAKKEENK